MRKRIISAIAALAAFMTLFGGFTSAKADYINDNILLEFARDGSQIMTWRKGEFKDDLRYLLVDITGDGNNELVVYDFKMEIFTVNNGKIEAIVTSSYEDSGSSGTPYIAYYNGEYYHGEDSERPANGMHKSLSKYINGQWDSLYTFKTLVNWETGEWTRYINDEQVSEDVYNEKLNDIIYSSIIPDEDYKTLDELEAELRNSRAYAGDNDTVLKAFAQNGAGILSELNKTTNEGLGYYLADLSGDENNELIVNSGGYLLVYMNDNGHVKLIAKEPNGHTGGYSFLNKYDGLYYLAWSSYSSWGFQSLSRYNNGQWDIIHSDLEDMMDSSNYQVNDEIVSKEAYEEHSYNVIHSDVLEDNDYMTLDELLRAETPIEEPENITTPIDFYKLIHYYDSGLTYLFKMKNNTNAVSQGTYIIIPYHSGEKDGTFPYGYTEINYEIEPYTTSYGEISFDPRFVLSSFGYHKYLESEKALGTDEYYMLVLKLDETDDIEEIKKELEENDIHTGWFNEIQGINQNSLNWLDNVHTEKAKAWLAQYVK